MGASNRQVQERFAYSRETISRCFHEVIEALLPLQNKVIKLPKADTPLGVRILEDTKYATYFTDCVGALDGTHINIRVPIEDRPRYRDRNGLLSQNVLAACNFDIVFCYILAGWEGSAHDGQVIRSARYQHGFQTPPGKYWLGDARYSNTDTVLILYRSTKYHLKEQYKSKQKPQNAKELFNLRHSSLRNVIERIFGVVKRKYRILDGAEFSIKTQVRLVGIVCALYNFVRQREGSNADVLLEKEKDILKPTPKPSIPLPDMHNQTLKTMDTFRDQLAERMWIDYQLYLQRHGVNDEVDVRLDD